MEAFLQFVWEQRLWTDLRPVSILEGCTVEVLDVGFCNRDAGPDFFEAKIRIDDITWVGTVEIHQRASEWLQHEHHLDNNYSSVIMHIVEEADCLVCSPEGRPLPTLVMTIPEELRVRANYLTSHALHLPCSPLAERLSTNELYAHLDTLASERLRQKAEAIQQIATDSDWYEALYITLMRYFGFNYNNEAMQALAQSLPYKLLIRYKDNPLQYEALMLGQASLLERLPDSAYRENLQSEYQFLATKHQLSPISPKLWRHARLRPANAPLRRLLQAMTIVRKAEFQPSVLAHLGDLLGLRQFFVPTDLSPELTELYRGVAPKLAIGEEMSDNLIINIALPFRSAMSLERSCEDITLCLNLLRSLKAERNQITRRFERAGILLRQAADSQAVIQAYKHYCRKRKCLYCPWGRRLMLRPAPSQTMY